MPKEKNMKGVNLVSIPNAKVLLKNALIHDICSIFFYVIYVYKDSDIEEIKGLRNPCYTISLLYCVSLKNQLIGVYLTFGRVCFWVCVIKR